MINQYVKTFKGESFILHSDAEKIVAEYSKTNRKKNNGLEYKMSEEENIDKRNLYIVTRDGNGWCGDSVCKIADNKTYNKYMKEEGEEAFRNFVPKYPVGNHYLEAYAAITSKQGVLGIDDAGIAQGTGSITFEQVLRLEEEGVKYTPLDKPRDNYIGDFEVPYDRFVLLTNEYRHLKDKFVQENRLFKADLPDVRHMKFMPTCLNIDEPEVHKIIREAVDSFGFVGNMDISVGGTGSNHKEVDLINIKTDLETVYIRVDYDKAEASVEYIEGEDGNETYAFTQHIPFEKFNTHDSEAMIPEKSFDQILKGVKEVYDNNISYKMKEIYTIPSLVSVVQESEDTEPTINKP